MNRREIEEFLISRASQNATFRQALILNPKQAMAQVGIIQPAHITIYVLEETATTLYIVLPYRP
ncbi:NHLP leader peptide family RiPP precursor [Romeria aff. gracilis LEGE 07310]|uniref:NHLP leader peptide family RiPP n=1 Tax=Vasconcelosia minhoensis LEGE 07310 TaxID=915328 RepID=A0A8J7DB79_9CYAN|nr:NHLP leader peptide family RiPP precursor [Romeria gracilis]MBE9077347.1 NHLP leader peptide family RiPP precursor [Romeria aff. gracilis LEGE 07310]